MKESLNKIIGKIESFFLNNMTLVIILLIIGIIGFRIFDKISIEYSFTAIGAILAFWYGYKKYERDKELEFINIYLDKVNTSKKTNIKDFLQICYKIFLLLKKGHISNDYQRFLDIEIIDFFSEIIEKRTAFVLETVENARSEFEGLTKSREAIEISKLTESLNNENNDHVRDVRLILESNTFDYDDGFLTYIYDTIEIFQKIYNMRDSEKEDDLYMYIKIDVGQRIINFISEALDERNK